MTETQRHKIIIQRKNIKKHDVNIFVWTPDVFGVLYASVRFNEIVL